MTEPVLLRVDKGVAHIVFNRPERLNALNAATGRSFEAAVTEALSQDDTRVVLLSGAGKSFLAGGDLAEFRGASDRAAAAAEVIEPTHRALRRLADGPAITIAAAHGAVAGAGVSIFSGADLGLAAQSATFTMAYSKVAAVPDSGGSWMLPRLIGLRRAMAFALLSETISADEAQAIGLVNAVMADDALEREALALARRLAGGPAVALRRTKGLLRGAFNADFSAHLEAEKAGFMAAAAHPDFAEGLEAFFGKRAPEFPSAQIASSQQEG